MDEKKIEATSLSRILSLVEGASRQPEKHNWLMTICIWAVIGTVVFFTTSRFGATTTGQAVLVIGAFVAGIVVTYAVINAWQRELWKHASRYFDAESVRKRIAELQ